MTWRRSNGYYGWMPMGRGMSISLSFGNRYDRDDDHWMFVRDRDIECSDIRRYCINREDHERVARNSTVINLTYQDRFGHVFLICATGLTGEQLRDAAKARIGNTPEQEREIVRTELGKINRIRLTSLAELAEAESARGE